VAGCAGFVLLVPGNAGIGPHSHPPHSHPTTSHRPHWTHAPEYRSRLVTDCHVGRSLPPLPSFLELWWGEPELDLGGAMASLRGASSCSAACLPMLMSASHPSTARHRLNCPITLPLGGRQFGHGVDAGLGVVVLMPRPVHIAGEQLPLECRELAYGDCGAECDPGALGSSYGVTCPRNDESRRSLGTRQLRGPH
jgi:hypothetical protein